MTKLQVARREIDTAVKLLFDGGDPIAVMVLAAAARGIVSSLCEIAGKRGLVDLLQEDFPNFARNSLFSQANRRANWFKHAGEKDAEQTLEDFAPEEADVILFWAIHDLGVLAEANSIEAGVFTGWFLATQAPGTMPIADNAFPGILDLCREQRLAFGKQLLKVGFSMPHERRPLDLIFKRDG